MAAALSKNKRPAKAKAPAQPRTSTHPVRTLSGAKGEKAAKALERMRRFIATLPETSEKLSHGAPTFWGGKKTFANFHIDHHGDERIAIWCKSDFDAQHALVEGNPEIFFVPPYVGPSGWIGIRVDRGRTDWKMVEGMLEEGYRMVAPKRALAELDAR